MAKVSDRNPIDMFGRAYGAPRPAAPPKPLLAMDRAPRRRRGPLTIRAVRPNLGLEIAYRRKLRELVDGMNADTLALIKKTYEFATPEMAQDAPPTPADALQAAMNAIARRWQNNFNEASILLADYFSTSVMFRTDETLKSALKKGGFAVEFRLTPGAKDILQATIEANVGLIKSIPQQYLTQVQGMVMRSVQTGRDASQLYKEIKSQYAVTRRRAELIARDQNNKATSAIQEARRKELGITEAIWMHSGGGKEPRPKHVKATGTRYKVGVGLPIGDKGQYVLPGEEINCRCVSRAVIPGFD